MNITTVGIDLAKNVFSVHGVDGHGKVVLKKTVTRSKLLECFANLPETTTSAPTNATVTSVARIRRIFAKVMHTRA